MDLVLHELSLRCTSDSELRHFAIKGLGMKANITNIHITNNRNDITSAAWRLLRDWLYAQTDCSAANENLSKALTAAEMEFYREVFI